MALTDLPLLIRDEPAITQVLGRSAAVLAVPEPALEVAPAPTPMPPTPMPPTPVEQAPAPAMPQGAALLVPPRPVERRSPVLLIVVAVIVLAGAAAGGYFVFLR